MDKGAARGRWEKQSETANEKNANSREWLGLYWGNACTARAKRM